MVLDFKIEEHGSFAKAVFWLKDWLNMPSILREILPHLSDWKILSISIKYTTGMQGRETFVRLTLVKTKDFEVQNEKRGQEGS
jgi:hypothetical protein